MTWTNGEITVGDIGLRQWVFEEHLTITGPSTKLPCEEGGFSPNVVTLKHVWDWSLGKYVMGVGTLRGPRLVGRKLGPEVWVDYDSETLSKPGCSGDVCDDNHEVVLTPDWLIRFAVDRAKLLPVPPGF